MGWEDVETPQVLIDKTGRFEKLDPEFQGSLMNLANQFYQVHQKPLVLTDTLRTQDEQAAAHAAKPTLALPANSPYAMHPQGMAVDFDQSQSPLIPDEWFAKFGLHRPALIGMGEHWHVEPVSTQGNRQGSSQKKWVDIDESIQPQSNLQLQPNVIMPETAQEGIVINDPGMMPGQQVTGPSTAPDMVDPMSASVNMFQNPFPTPEPETVAGLAAGMKGPLGVTAPLTGMAVAVTGGAKRAFHGKQETYRPSDYALMEQGLPIVSDEMMRDAGIAGAFDVIGGGVAKVAGYLLSPLAKQAGKIKDVLTFAKDKGIPIPADAAGSKVGALAENIPDIGLGGMATQWRRKKTAEGLTQAVKEITEIAGVPPKSGYDVAQDLGEIFKGLVSGSSEYTKLQKVLSEMPQERIVPLLELKNAVINIGSAGLIKLKTMDDATTMKIFNEKGEQYYIEKGLERIENVYGKNAPAFVKTLKELNENGWVATPNNISTIDKLINKGISKKGWEGGTGQTQSMADRLKGRQPKDYIGDVSEEYRWRGFHDDLLNFTTDQGDNLGKLVLGKNEAFKDAMGFINQINPELKLLYQRSGKLRPGQSRWEITGYEKNLETVVDKIFDPRNTKYAELIKGKLTELGRTDVWDAAKLAWLEKSFQQNTFKRGDDLFFDPAKYKKWFNQNEEYLRTIMPENYPGLQKWNQISNVFEKDMKRLQSGKERTGMQWAGSVGLGGPLGFAFGAQGAAVPQAFSFISALSVMPYTGFVRKWLTSQGMPKAAEAIGQATKGALTEYEFTQ